MKYIIEGYRKLLKEMESLEPYTRKLEEEVKTLRLSNSRPPCEERHIASVVASIMKFFTAEK